MSTRPREHLDFPKCRILSAPTSSDPTYNAVLEDAKQSLWSYGCNQAMIDPYSELVLIRGVHVSPSYNPIAWFDLKYPQLDVVFLPHEGRQCVPKGSADVALTEMARVYPQFDSFWRVWLPFWCPIRRAIFGR